MRRVFYKTTLVLIITLFTGLGTVLAKETKDSQEKEKKHSLLARNIKKRTTIEFDEQKIKGVRRIPLGSLITKERSYLKTNLILLRKSWKKKIINSTNWL